MESPTSTRDLVGDDRRDEPRPVDRDRDGDGDAGGAQAASRVDDEARDTTTRSGTAGFAERSETAADDSPELLPREQNAEFQTRWEKIQTGFVDEPRQTVEQADELVAEVMKRLAEGFATERERLEGQWGRGEDVSTEDLRVTLQRYRGFFQRLLSA
jgi:hypothetical protein